MRNLLNDIINDIKVELLDEFDKNFERKGFFSDKWQPEKRVNGRGSLMMRSGRLRKSITARESMLTIRFTASVPYSKIHNEGGKIKVTAKMKRYFWVCYYKAIGGLTRSKTGKVSNSKRNLTLTAEAQYWRALALKKTGSFITIPKRQFIGSHRLVDTAIQAIINNNITNYLRRNM